MGWDRMGLLRHTKPYETKQCSGLPIHRKAPPSPRRMAYPTFSNGAAAFPMIERCWSQADTEEFAGDVLPRPHVCHGKKVGV